MNPTDGCKAANAAATRPPADVWYGEAEENETEETGDPLDYIRDMRLKERMEEK